MLIKQVKQNLKQAMSDYLLYIVTLTILMAMI